MKFWGFGNWVTPPARARSCMSCSSVEWLCVTRACSLCDSTFCGLLLLNCKWQLTPCSLGGGCAEKIGNFSRFFLLSCWRCKISHLYCLRCTILISWVGKCFPLSEAFPGAFASFFFFFISVEHSLVPLTSP